MKSRSLLFGSLLFLALDVTADESLHLGNLAPTTPGTGGVLMRIADQEIALAYRAFAALDLPRGEYLVQAFDAATGMLLAQEDIDFRPQPVLTPVLFLAGDGDVQPYRIIFEQLAEAGGAAQPPDLIAAGFVFHHAAPVVADADALRIRVELECDGDPRVLPSSSGAEVDYLGRWSGYDELPSGIVCDLQVGNALVGGFQLPLRTPTEVFTRRAFLIGDSRGRPLQVLLLDGSAQVDLVDAAAPQPRPLSSSRDQWFDVRRPDQGFSLYEVGGTGIVFGTWFSVGTDNEPIWYYFEGAKVQGIGRRDMTLFLGSRVDGAQDLQPVGSGRLQYVDCNEAEFRVLIGASDFRTVRLRRSRPVSFCPVFD